MLAEDVTAFLDRRTEPLPGDLHQAEFRDAADIHLGLVVLHAGLDLLFHLPDMLFVAHIDEVHDDQAAEIPEPQLPGELLGRFHVGQKNRLLKILILGSAAGIDINGHQRLGGIDDNGTAGGEVDGGLVDLFDLLFNLVEIKDGPSPFMQPDLGHPLAGRQEVEKIDHLLIGNLVIHQDFLDFMGEMVPQKTGGHILFLVDQGRGGHGLAPFFDLLPQVELVADVLE